jgi:hypothetical protein
MIPNQLQSGTLELNMPFSNQLADSKGLYYIRGSDLDVEKQQIIPELAALSGRIFNTPPNDRHSSTEEWLKRLSSHPQATIIYVLESIEIPHPNPVALLFAFPSGERMHVWIAGVRADHRKEGLLSQMMTLLEKQCKEHLENNNLRDLSTGEAITLFSICTYPDKFTDMWDWLRKRGWTVEKDEGQGKIRLIKSL